MKIKTLYILGVSLEKVNIPYHLNAEVCGFEFHPLNNNFKVS